MVSEILTNAYQRRNLPVSLPEALPAILPSQPVVEQYYGYGWQSLIAGHPHGPQVREAIVGSAPALARLLAAHVLRPQGILTPTRRSIGLTAMLSVWPVAENPSPEDDNPPNSPTWYEGFEFWIAAMDRTGD